MKNLIEIQNLISENIPLTKSDFFIYVDNTKIPLDEFSLENSNENYSLTISQNIFLTGTVYFFINTTTLFSNIIYIYYDIGLIEFNPTMSSLGITLPSDLESFNYALSFLTFNNKNLSSTPIPLTVCNGISSTSSINLQSSTTNDKTFEVILFDNTGIPAPNGDYVIEILIGE